MEAVPTSRRERFMPTDVIMPQMGESIFEGTITKWLKKPGDPVEKDEPLFEISTDKVDAEIPSPVAGTLSEIKFPEGATVQVNTVVAVLSDSGSSIAASDPQKKLSGSKAQSPVPEVPLKGQLPQPQRAQSAGGTEIVMPQMGESIFEGTITKWLKKVGDPVQKDEPLFEISTDKVDAEIPSPVDGVLTEIKFEEGATAQVNEVVAVVGGSAPVASAGVTSSLLPKTQSSTPASATQSIAPQQAKIQSPEFQGSSAVRSSPLVRRIAREHSVDLARIAGTGTNGRITKDDILAYLAAGGRGYAATQLAPKAELAPPQMAQELKEEVVAMSKMRAIIAERMAESTRSIPHAHTVYKVDMTRIARLRERERAAFEQRR